MGSSPETGYTSLFDGTSLTGWTAIPRIYGTAWPGGPDAHPARHPEGVPETASRFPAAWSVENGAIVGRQNGEQDGWGGYLLSDQEFGDFELVLEMNPDWQADTGVLLRRKADSWHGFQVLVDHRMEGSIGGFFGNGLADFHALPFTIGLAVDDEGNPTGLREFGPAVEPKLAGFTPNKRAVLSYAARPEEFLRVWKWRDWNELRVRCVGELPVLTTWVNGVKVAELDTNSLQWPNYDAHSIRDFMGSRGRIALEVHDRHPLGGDDYWAPGAVCRWRNIRIQDFTGATSADELDAR